MKYEYTLVASIVGTVEADTFFDAVKEANTICKESQAEIDLSAVNLDLRLAVEMVQKVND